ncbi:MAG: MlaD family protein [Rhodospirillales bacterium]
MRSNKVNYLVVGSFVILTMIGLVVTVAWLSGRTGPTDSYHAVYNNVTGVKFGTQVLYEGYPIGQVTEVTPVFEDSRMRFRVDFDVQQGWQLPRDSVAQIGASSLLAAVSLNIKAGKSAMPLPVGERILAKESANLMDVLAGVATEIAVIAEEDLKPLIGELTRGGSIIGDILERDGAEIIAKVKVLIDDLSGRAPTIVDQVASFASDLERLGVNLNRSADEMNAILTPETRETVLGVVDHLDRAAAQIDNLMMESNVMIGSASDILEGNKEDVERMTDDLRHSAETLARHIDSINHHLDGASRNMYEFSRQIRQNPGLLLGGTPAADNADSQ